VKWNRPWLIYLKAEVLLWFWLEEGMQWSHATVLAAGAFARVYGPDRKWVRPQESRGNNWHLHLEVNWNGLYPVRAEVSPPHFTWRLLPVESAGRLGFAFYCLMFGAALRW
jgi:hypothetical protein